jgi:PPOX class probable F420-dependent enzyme
MRLPEREVERLLGTWPVARLATLDPSGRPHLVPIVFATHAGVLWSAIDEKPKSTRDLARVRHLRRDPRATLLLDHYDDDWKRLWWIRLDVIGTVVEPDALDRAAALEALRGKYAQYRARGLLASDAPLLRFEIQAIRSWRAT